MKFRKSWTVIPSYSVETNTSTYSTADVILFTQIPAEHGGMGKNSVNVSP